MRYILGGRDGELRRRLEDNVNTRMAVGWTWLSIVSTEQCTLPKTEHRAETQLWRNTFHFRGPGYRESILQVPVGKGMCLQISFDPLMFRCRQVSLYN
jgi:hypothetical protein